MKRFRRFSAGVCRLLGCRADGYSVDMARAGDEIFNPITGERIVFVRTAAETGGELLEFEDFWTKPGHRAPEHVHPKMEESWEVLSGRPCFRIAREEILARAGDIVVAPPGIPHMGWNAGDDEVYIKVRMRPALRWEEFMVKLFEMAESGRVDESGTPEPALMMQLLTEFADEIAPPPANTPPASPTSG